MKRSEAVQIIKNKLQGSEGMKSDESRASYILRALEDAGMAPPEIDSGIYNRADCANYMEHEWEDEDE